MTSSQFEVLTMGKMVLISGGNGSGKSRYAENLVSKTTGSRYYIATMQPQTEDNFRRVKKHIAQREGLNFTTLELPTHIRKAEIQPNAVVLLEDVSNLLGNTIFSQTGNREDVLGEILALRNQCSLLIAVTIGGLSSEAYQGETAAYIDDLNSLNESLLSLADAAVIMVDGSPVWEKGNEDGIF